uniref:Uncharacterized protein n=1 Tax=Oryza punctata TaxID=4537 RepID=A0A0E0JYE3_ORYPU
MITTNQDLGRKMLGYLKDGEGSSTSSMENGSEASSTSMKKTQESSTPIKSGEEGAPGKKRKQNQVALCIAVVELIQELTDKEKVKALGLFRCPLNREIFTNTTSRTMRLLWLRSQIAA